MIRVTDHPLSFENGPVILSLVPRLPRGWLPLEWGPPYSGGTGKAFGRHTAASGLQSLPLVRVATLDVSCWEKTNTERQEAGRAPGSGSQLAFAGHT